MASTNSPAPPPPAGAAPLGGAPLPAGPAFVLAGVPAGDAPDGTTVPPGACVRLCIVRCAAPTEIRVISAPPLDSVIVLTFVPCATILSEPARETTSELVDVMPFASSVIVRLCPG